MAVLMQRQRSRFCCRARQFARSTFACAVASVALFAARGAARDPAESQIKAAFILNFARFVDWPASAFTNSDSPLVVGVVGVDPFDGILNSTLSGKMVDTHPLVVRHVTKADEVLRCHILFVADSEKSRLKAIVRDTSSHPILTVSDIDNITDAGGIIWLKRRQDMIRFEINRAAAEANGLKISARLFKLADNSRDK